MGGNFEVADGDGHKTNDKTHHKHVLASVVDPSELTYDYALVSLFMYHVHLKGARATY